MRDAGPRALDAEMDDEQRRRIALLFEARLGPLAAARRLQQVAIGVHDVAVRGDGIGLHRPAALRGDAGHPVAQRLDRGDGIAEAQRAAQPLEMRDQPRDQPVGAAAREPHTAVALQFVDQRVDGAGRHRIAADQQSVERQRLAQFLVFHELRHDRIDRPPRLVFRQRGRRLHHRREVEEGDMAELFIAFAVHALGIFEEAVVAGDVGGIELADLTLQRRFIVRVIEVRAVGPIEAVEGRHRLQRDVARHVGPGQRPQFLQAGRIGDDGRAGVEGEAVLFPIIGPAARPVARFDDRRRDARRLQPDRQRQPAESRSDDDRRLHVFYPCPTAMPSSAAHAARDRPAPAVSLLRCEPCPRCSTAPHRNG